MKRQIQSLGEFCEKVVLKISYNLVKLLEICV